MRWLSIITALMCPLVASNVFGQVVGGVMKVTGAEMH